MDVVFVILNYNSIYDTEEAIEYISANVDTDNYGVVIVDNASPNGDGEELKQYYSDNTNVVVIQSEENLGFARGNNLGFAYAKKNLSPDFIVMMNSDILLLETKLYSKIKDLYDKYQFAVLGPTVVNSEYETHSNPHKCCINTIEDVDVQIYKNSRNIILAKLKIDWIKNWIVKMRHDKYDMNYKTFCNVQRNVLLTGCIWIFSEIYIKEFNGIDQRTFMYHEEEILFHHMKNKGMEMIYAPDIVVYHKGEVSTKTVYRSKRNRRIFNCLESNKSLEVLKEIIKEGQ